MHKGFHLKKIIYFWLCGSSLLLGLSLVVLSGGYCLVVLHGLLIAVASLVEHGLQGLWAPVLVAQGLCSCGSGALEHRLSNCGAWASLFCSMWDLPRPGVEPKTLALASKFFSTEPPGKPNNDSWRHLILFFQVF